MDADDVVYQAPLRWGLIARLLRFLGPHKLRMAGNVVLVGLSSGAMLLGTFAYREIVGCLEVGPEYRTRFYVWVGILALNALVVWQLEYYREMGLVKLGQRVLLDLRMTLFRHLQRLSLSYYDRTKQGWIISRATSDLGVLEDIITWAVPELSRIVFLIGGGTIMVIVLAPFLFWVLAGVVPLMVLVTFFFHGHIATAWRAVRTQISRICANLAENIAGVRVVQAFTRERRNLHEFDRLNEEYYRARVKAAIVHTLYFPSIGVLSAVATAAVILLFRWQGEAAVSRLLQSVATSGDLLRVGWYASVAILASPQPIRIKDMIMVLVMLRRFFEPIRHLSHLYGTALGSMAAAERIFGLLDTEPDVKDRPGARELPTIEGTVRFDGVTFAYNEGETVLENINLEAKPGRTVALVGPTGAGKSSIINLLCRFYEQQEGQITVDDYDIRDVTMHSLRSQMGIVMQEPFLFSGTVMENIKFGRPEATDDEVHEAARAIGAHDILAGLRNGFETEVQERGEGLSGGERQLVCFTRAMVADPRILVLDEATSSVDTATELKIQEAVDHLVQRRTSFVAAHRLSTVRSADQVLVVQGGRIIERGTHTDLLARGGEYARMYREFLREG
ncbi:MAG: hypothetical protein AMS16_02140 [Planctomycetes bacterium DG_58]|nr:MAG: hypothetical protein AMS16_02140 [Planctomycetes bacterium DG_58]KPL01868.1 MAG: hypothetical protein AMK75_03665 [Planctomycetes bacterium SM23_65]